MVRILLIPIHRKVLFCFSRSLAQRLTGGNSPSESAARGLNAAFKDWRLTRLDRPAGRVLRELKETSRKRSADRAPREDGSVESALQARLSLQRVCMRGMHSGTFLRSIRS
jgi:hypothetical protein